MYLLNNVAVCCMVGDFRGYKFSRNRPKSIFGSVSRSMNPLENFSTCNSKGVVCPTVTHDLNSIAPLLAGLSHLKLIHDEVQLITTQGS